MPDFEMDTRADEIGDIPELTHGGFAWVLDNYTDSIVARVAINGEINGWPAAHRRIAVIEANTKGMTYTNDGEA